MLKHCGLDPQAKARLRMQLGLDLRRYADLRTNLRRMAKATSLPTVSANQTYQAEHSFDHGRWSQDWTGYDDWGTWHGSEGWDWESEWSEDFDWDP